MATSCVQPISKNCLVAFIGVAISSLGITLLALHTWIPNYLFESIFVLKPNSPIINLWLKNPMELRMNFYFFNWTNPEEFYNLDVEPKFNQVGPYTYLVDIEKINVNWNNNNNTITYEMLRTWSLIEEHKNACTNDKITTVNAVTPFAAHLVNNWSHLSKRMISSAISINEPDIEVVSTAQQLLFDGHDHIVMDLLRLTPFNMPDIPYLERFSWLTVFNGTSAKEGLYNSGNGINGNFEFLTWNYESHSPYFNAACSKVHGSTGEFFNGRRIQKYIELFIPIFGRNTKFDYEKEVVVDGISGQKFSLGSSFFDNGSIVKGNDCYCNGECLPSGMINLSACYYNLPIFGSLPHFLTADPVYLNSVEGLKPQEIEHETYLVVEPNTGIPLEALLRFQVNILIQPIEDVSMVQGSRKIFFPVWWFEQKIEIPKIIKVVIIIYLILPYVLLTVGLLLLVVGSYLLLFKTFKPIICQFLNKTKSHNSTEFAENKDGEKLLQPTILLNR